MNNIAGQATLTCGRVAPRLGGELRSNSPTSNNRLLITAVIAAFALSASASLQAAEPPRAANQGLSRKSGPRFVRAGYRGGRGQADHGDVPHTFRKDEAGQA